MNKRRGNHIKIWSITAVGLAILGGAVWFVYRSNRKPQAEPLPEAKLILAESLGYVGSKTCASCHEEIARTFAEHPMGQSIRPVNDARQIEDYVKQNPIKAGHAQYDVRLEQSKAIHREQIFSPDGATLVDHPVDVIYTVGSGSRGRSYFMEQAGRLYQSPLTWYVEKKFWDLAPGYVPDQHQRFERRITSECLSCHAGQMNYFEGDHDRNQVDRPFAEMSIGCERCHGPGAQHVAWQGDGTGKDNIVNPAKLAEVERNSVCNQCHLGGKARILREGKSFYDFRPGQRLGDTWTVFVAGTGFNRAGKALFTSHVEQMRASKCFQESKGTMTCYSCHDPHRSPGKEEKKSFYRAKCLTCHGEQDCSLPKKEQAAPPANDSCFHCHMPRAESSDINHASLADHRVFKTPEEFEHSNQEADKLRPWTLFPGMGEDLTQWERDRAFGVARFKQSRKVHDNKLVVEAQSLLRSALRERPDDPLTNSYLGQVHFSLNEHEEAEKFFSKAIQGNAFDRTAWSLMSVSSFQLGHMEGGFSAIERSLKLEPWKAMEYGLYGEMLARQGRHDEAIAIMKRGLEINPMLIRLHAKLAELLQKKGESEAADNHRLAIIRLKEFGELVRQPVPGRQGP